MPACIILTLYLHIHCIYDKRIRYYVRGYTINKDRSCLMYKSLPIIAFINCMYVICLCLYFMANGRMAVTASFVLENGLRSESRKLSCATYCTFFFREIFWCEFMIHFLRSHSCPVTVWTKICLFHSLMTHCFIQCKMWPQHSSA